MERRRHLWRELFLIDIRKCNYRHYTRVNEIVQIEENDYLNLDPGDCNKILKWIIVKCTTTLDRKEQLYNEFRT